MFAPSGEGYVMGRISYPPNIGYVVVPTIEIGLQPTHGTAVDTASQNVAAVQITGIAGGIKVYRR